MQAHRFAVNQRPSLLHREVQFPPGVKTMLVVEELGVPGDVVSATFPLKVFADHGRRHVVVPEPGAVVVWGVLIAWFGVVTLVGNP